MTEQITKKAAYITASDPTGTGGLAEALHAHGYQIVSDGDTVRYLEDKTPVAVTETATFMKGLNSQTNLIPHEDLQLYPTKSRREIVAAQVSQHLSLRRDRLQGMGVPIIDVLYARLEPTSQEEDTERDYHWPEADMARVNHIAAAIRGRRTVLVRPEQLADYIQRLTSDAEPENQSAYNRELAAVAATTLSVYFQHFGVNIGALPIISRKLPGLSTQT